MYHRILGKNIYSAECVLFNPQKVHVLHVKLNNLSGSVCVQICRFTQALVHLFRRLGAFLVQFRIRMKKQVVSPDKPSQSCNAGYFCAFPQKDRAYLFGRVRWVSFSDVSYPRHKFLRVIRLSLSCGGAAFIFKGWKLFGALKFPNNSIVCYSVSASSKTANGECRNDGRSGLRSLLR